MGLHELQVPVIAPLGPAEVEPDQSRVVVGDTGPSVPNTSHIFDRQCDCECGNFA